MLKFVLWNLFISHNKIKIYDHNAGALRQSLSGDQTSGVIPYVPTIRKVFSVFSKKSVNVFKVDESVNYVSLYSS